MSSLAQGVQLSLRDSAVTAIREPINLPDGFSHRPADPSKHRSEGSARFLARKHVAHPELLDDALTVLDLIESATQFL